MKTFVILLALLTIATGSGCTKPADNSPAGEVVPGIPAKDTVTLVDLGATTCIPCRMMAPILEELREEYKGRAKVIFIDIWDRTNEGKAQAFGVMAIPTQIFYDRRGREVFRHQGFFDKKSMLAKLEEILAGP